MLGLIPGIVLVELSKLDEKTLYKEIQEELLRRVESAVPVNKKVSPAPTIENVDISSNTRPSNGRRRKRKLSPEGRARIIAATKKRWALKRAEQATDEQTTKPVRKRRKKRKLSPEGRAAIIAAAKRRWAALKKG